MMNNIRITLVAVLLVLAQLVSATEGVKLTSFKLDNGLEIYINENHSKPEIFGMFVVKAGGKEDPADATGMAHYMEHMLFKGTTKIGTTNWKNEKVHLDRIRALYDSLALTKVEGERKKIQEKINKESLEAGKYIVPNEFSKVINAMGGTGLNANTGPDRTVYFNTFPSNQLGNWLEIYTQRFIEPVFRGFQSELEVVYEEKNMYADQMVSNLFEEFNRNFYKKHPYGQQPLIGTTEHLKNPSLNKMYKFLHDWYVPNNMALILSGDINVENAKPIIEKHLSALKYKDLPKRVNVEEKPFSGREQFKVRMSPITLGVIGFRTVPANHPDQLALNLCQQLLTNEHETGLLNKLVNDGGVMVSEAFAVPQNDYGAFAVLVIPNFLFQRFSSAEKKVLAEINKLKTGEFDSEIFETLKRNKIIELELMEESNESIALTIGEAYAQNKDITEELNILERYKKITKEDIARVAKKYFTDDYLVMISKRGEADKDYVEKPGFKPVVSKEDKTSEYVDNFTKSIKTELQNCALIEGVDYKKSNLPSGVRFNYVNNTKNDVFDLSINFNKGTLDIPELSYITSVLNSSAPQGVDNDEFKKDISKLSANFSFSTSPYQTVLSIQGTESNLHTTLFKVLNLLKKPEYKKDVYKKILKDTKMERKYEKSEVENLSRMLFAYSMVKDNSTYLNRPKIKHLKRIKEDRYRDIISELISNISDVYYFGNKSENDIKKLVDSNLKFISSKNTNAIVSKIPYLKYTEDKVLYMHKKNLSQSSVWMYMNLGKLTEGERAKIRVFNEYFGGGFTGIILQEVREFRSMAYSADAVVLEPGIKDDDVIMIAVLTTQADKTIEAMKLVKNLIRDMPEKPGRIENIKNQIIRSSAINKPNPREVGGYIESLYISGEKRDRTDEINKAISGITFEDIKSFWESKVKNTPIVFSVVSDKKRVDVEQLKQFGKFTELKLKNVRTK